MGYEANCKGSWGQQSAEGKAMLETDFLQFRSDEFRFKALLKDLSEVKSTGDKLAFQFEGKKAALYLGEKDAPRWANKILNPPGRLDKLGVKPESTVHLEGEFESAFVGEVESRSVELECADLIFLAVHQKAFLTKAPALATRMRRDAALWIVYPKGRTEIREMDVLNAGRACGLKDVKVVRFSEVETALKFVVPVAERCR